MRRVLFPSIVLLVAVFGGCARRAAPPVRPAPPRPAPGASLEDAKRTVVKYVQSLEAGDYAAAHALLTAESRKKHPLDEFRSQAGQEVTAYDLGKASVREGGPGKARVAVPLEEDPATQNFALVREQNHWRIVYDRGRPWAPYNG